MDTQGTEKKAASGALLHRVPRCISRAIEDLFYKLGYEIAKHPVKWILTCALLVLACLLGLFRFRQEKNPLRLWIPPDSDFVRDTEWLMSKFGEGQRIETMIMTGEDVLEPKALLELNEITKRLLAVKTASQPAASWTDLCFKVPIISGVISREKRDVGTDDDFFEQAPGARTNASAPYEPIINVPSDIYCSIVESLPRGCLFQSILDVWEYDSELIANQTKGEILERLNAVKTSPTLGHPMIFTELLGGVKTDEQGRVVSANAVKTLWYVHVNFTNLKMNETGNESGTADWVTAEVLDWEAALLRELEASARDLASRNPVGTSGKSLNIWYQAGRSWSDTSAETMVQDFGKILIGILIMSVYVQIILSRFNWVEWRFCLASVGLVCVAGAFVVTVGLCSLCGIPYGPVHTSLPFMLMGLGVDDIFVIMASWDQIISVEANRSRPLSERIAMMLSHAGAAIFVTSLTDVVAFAIGASTILPSLQSFCIYAAVGVMMTFVLQVTFFAAFFTLDVKRSEAKRNGAFPCVIHPNHIETFHDSRKSVSSRFLDLVYSRIILSLPGKLTVILMTLGLASFGVLGYSRLEQWFDPEWFIPSDTYPSDFLRVKGEHFPKRGHPASIFIGEVEYSEELPRIISLVGTLKNMSSTIDQVEAWPQEFAHFVSIHYNKDVTKGKMEDDDFHNYLSKYLFSRSGGRYQSKFRFATNLTCGKVAPRILVSVIDFSFVTFTGPDQWIPAMDGVKALARDSRINGHVIVWSHIFASWVTDKVIADEVNRNLILALVCVMATTAVLIAEPQTCFWIFLCVLLTLIDVCGFMYYWGLTIDIVSCIGLELAVGLSVDYAAHVAHAFLNAPANGEGENRTVRTLTALRHIGAAVAYGAGSTLLAQSMMAFSKAYVFRAFFKIFFMVVIFGLWHGLVLLPVVLSSIGPRSLRPSMRRVATVDADNVKDAIELNAPLNQ